MPEAGTRPVLDLSLRGKAARTFRAAPSHVAQARQFVADLLGASPVREDAILCLSEIAANAVLHSASARPGGTFTVQVSAIAAGVRIDVTDAGGPWRSPAEPDGLAGHGLDIVARVATRWGITGGEAARTVWFELAS
jgi:anti-sigma regulatory factor (Ser/Thr protein kinase)